MRSLAIIAVALAAGCSGQQQNSAQSQTHSATQQAQKGLQSVAQSLQTAAQSVQKAAQNAATSAPAKEAKDAYLTAAVGTKLATVDVDAASAVHVAVANGVATLTGQAHSAKELAQYAQAARSVSGVKAVVNKITVNPSLHGIRSQVGDAELQARVSAAIAQQAGSNVFHVNTAAHDGNVTLTGTVPSNAIRQTIVNTVRGVQGVRTVNDRLTVRTH